jgi:WD40 repeat protein
MSENSKIDSETSKTDEASATTDTTGQFFSVGTPLHAVRAGYIRRRADDLLYEAVISGRFAHVIAPDRSGKSSLIAATSVRLENNGFHVAVLDLEQIGDRDAGVDAGRWYYSVAYRLLRQLRIRFELQSWWQDKSVLSNRQRLLEFYSEVILQNLQQRIVIFVDEIQCIEALPFADQLLASIRAAHNARTTDPDFSRLTFVLLGECDPVSLIQESELSPFSVTQAITLGDFTRPDLNLFATELNLDAADAELALDRVYYWTRGQPYLSQKLARAVARENLPGDVAGNVDRIVMQQLAGRAALHSEPHMSHIHRQIVNDEKNKEALLNLYGRLRKGIEVPADLGSKLQRRLMAFGLLEIDESGELRIRNRIYERVFTARWANENLPTRWRAPAIALGALLLVALIPLWYTQWLPRSYQNVLIAMNTELVVAERAWINLRSFPGHADVADNLYTSFLRGRAGMSSSVAEVQAIAALAADLPDAGTMPQQLVAELWDRRSSRAMQEERRDDALMASLESLLLSTPGRRSRSAMLLADDYPLLLASLPADERNNAIFNAGSLLLTATDGARISQWSLGPQGLSRIEDWNITALEVSPLVRRVIVDREGTASRLGLTLNISHPRLSDLRIKLIAPSGRAVELDLNRERASSNEDIRVASAQLVSLLGESLTGTWSLSLRDEATGVAGHLVGWNLTLNSQGLIEDFQRGLSIPDPIERETDQFWIDDDGRYAVARATQSDSARLWDLAFAKPVSTIAVNENERLIGLGNGARRLITATLDTVNLWDTATGKKSETLPVGAASATTSLTADGQHLLALHRSDIETRLELWDVDVAEKDSELTVAGTPALVALDANGQRIAIADYDRAVRVWDFLSGEMLAQIDLPMQPSEIKLNAGGEVLAVIYGSAGISLWSVANLQSPLLEEYGDGRWQFEFSPSGARFVVGRPRTGFQIHESSSGRLIGPPVGVGDANTADNMLGFSKDEDVLLTGASDGNVRFWQIPATNSSPLSGNDEHKIWRSSGDAVVAVLPDSSAFAIADQNGHVHFMNADAGSEAIKAASEDVSFVGHNDAVRRMAVSSDGALLASVAADNTLRVWNTADGLPRQFISNLPGSGVDRVLFSPDSSLIAVLNDSWAGIVDAQSGEIVVEKNLGESHVAAAFGHDNKLYLGSQSGKLNLVGRDATGVWGLQRIWQSESAIRWIEASPRGRFLVLVYQNNVAQQFNLLEGNIGNSSLELPSPVEEVAFSPGGSRVLFRTSRWIHRAASSGNGLTQLDSLFAPKALAGARMVFGDSMDNAYMTGSQVYLPVVRDGGVHLELLQFNDREGAGLFGNRKGLLQKWSALLSISSGEPQ